MCAWSCAGLVAFSGWIALRPVAARAATHSSSPASASVWQTTFDLSDALTDMGSLSFTGAPKAGSQVIDVSSAIHYQRITGFGAAMTDSAAWLLQEQLSPAARTIAFQSLFGASGIHLNFLRIPIGASDFTATGVPYTYDDVPAGQADPSLADFSIAHDQAYVIPALQAALAQNSRIVTYANPWTPPPWMKANDAYGNIGEQGVVLAQFYPVLAQYFVKFIQAYGAAGVPIDDISVQNEPRGAALWPTTNFNAGNEAQFISQDLEPALTQAGIPVHIWGLEESDNALGDASTLLTSAIGPQLDGIAFHCYAGMGGMTTLHDQYPSEQIAVTECSPGIINYSAAEVAIDATRNWAGVATLWNLALDPAGGPVEPPDSGCPHCTGVITVNEQTHLASYGRNYYEFGQVSRYVAPGAVRIFSTRLVADDGGAVTPGVDDVAFLNPNGTKVLVAYNSGPRTSRIAIDWQGRYLNWSLRPRATVTLRWR